jgi:hypothetical protein
MEKGKYIYLDGKHLKHLYLRDKMDLTRASRFHIGVEMRPQTYSELVDGVPCSRNAWVATLSDVLALRERIDSLLRHNTVLTSTIWIVKNFEVTIQTCPIVEKPYAAISGYHVINPDMTLTYINDEALRSITCQDLAYIHLPDPIPRGRGGGIVSVTKGTYASRDRYDVFLEPSDKNAIGAGIYVVAGGEGAVDEEMPKLLRY